MRRRSHPTVTPESVSPKATYRDQIPPLQSGYVHTDDDFTISDFLADENPIFMEETKEANLHRDKNATEMENSSDDTIEPNKNMKLPLTDIFQRMEQDATELGSITTRERNQLVKEVKALAMKQKDSMDWLGELMRDMGEIFSEIKDFCTNTNTPFQVMQKNSVKTNYMKAILSDLSQIPPKVQSALSELTNYSSVEVEPEVLHRILQRAPLQQEQGMFSGSPLLINKDRNSDDKINFQNIPPIKLDFKNDDDNTPGVPMDIIDLVVETELSQLSVREEKSDSTELSNNAYFSSTPRFCVSLANMPHLQSAPGFKIEEPQDTTILQDNNTISSEAPINIDIVKKECPYTSVFLGKEHDNYIGNVEGVGPVAISIFEEGGRIHTLTRTKIGEDYKVIDASEVKKKLFSKQHDRKSLIKAANLPFKTETIKRIKNAKITTDLQEMESQQKVNNFKFGVLFCKANQTHENEMFGNITGSTQYEEFLDFLGDRILLKGWKYFRGGLDVKSGSTGTHSIHTIYDGFEVMFHVSTLLPYKQHDQQQLERKRHLGNDIVVIVFKEGNTPFRFDTIKSEFVHVIFIVSVDKNLSTASKTFYNLSVICKEDVPGFAPVLTNPPVFEKAYAAPAFVEKFKLTRTRYLDYLEKSYMQTK